MIRSFIFVFHRYEPVLTDFWPESNYPGRRSTTQGGRFNTDHRIMVADDDPGPPSINSTGRKNIYVEKISAKFSFTDVSGVLGHTEKGVLCWFQSRLRASLWWTCVVVGFREEQKRTYDLCSDYFES